MPRISVARPRHGLAYADRPRRAAGPSRRLDVYRPLTRLVCRLKDAYLPAWPHQHAWRGRPDQSFLALPGLATGNSNVTDIVERAPFDGRPPAMKRSRNGHAAVFRGICRPWSARSARSTPRTRRAKEAARPTLLADCRAVWWSSPPAVRGPPSAVWRTCLSQRGGRSPR